MSIYDQIVQGLNFPLILLTMSLITGAIFLIDIIFWSPKRGAAKLPPAIDFCRAFFGVFFIVLIVRSFVFSPFRIPSGSLKPTILPGDFVFTNHFSYGLHFPVSNTKFLRVGLPKRGDIMVFHHPINPKVDLIKRVLGVPGDRISYIDKVFYINGKKLTQRFIKKTRDSNSAKGPSWPVSQYQEDLGTKKHGIYRNAKFPVENFYNLMVPKGKYLLIGDNRDNSDDGRYWGFVSDKNIIGKASFIYMSWDAAHKRVRWHRIGTRI